MIEQSRKIRSGIPERIGKAFQGHFAPEISVDEFQDLDKGLRRLFAPHFRHGMRAAHDRKYRVRKPALQQIVGAVPNGIEHVQQLRNFLAVSVFGHKRRERLAGKVKPGFQKSGTDQDDIIFRTVFRYIKMRFETTRERDFALPHDSFFRIDMHQAFPFEHKDEFDAVVKMRQHLRTARFCNHVFLEINIICRIRFFFVK